jgi:hypothetical protein
MRIIDNNLAEDQYRHLIKKHLTLEELKEGFSAARVDYYGQERALWEDLRDLFQTASIDARSFPKKNGILIEGDDVTSLILCEALEFSLRAFCNFYAQDKLVEHGYGGWSEVTSYYSSFFSIHSLLRLQGRSITRIWRPEWNQYHVFPFDFTTHKYVVCRCKGPHHQIGWELYFDVYDSFLYEAEPNFYQVSRKANVEDPTEEWEFRNQVNYQPYFRYQEVRNPQVIPSLISQYSQNDLPDDPISTLVSLTTDPYYKYYARTELRLIFFRRLLADIAGGNSSLNTLLTSKNALMRSFLSTVSNRQDVNSVSVILPSLMGI